MINKISIQSSSEMCDKTKQKMKKNKVNKILNLKKQKIYDK